MLQVMNMQGCGSKQGSWKQTRSCSYLCLTRKTTGCACFLGVVGQLLAEPSGQSI